MNIFVTGTDTNIGKTFVASLMALKLGYKYWKPVQTGSAEGTDSQFVSQLIGANRVYKESYCLTQPFSPHQAARQEGVVIELSQIYNCLPFSQTVIEGAGGVLVPLNDNNFVIDMIALFQCPVILVARATLGTINHTLLSIEALRSRNIDKIAVITVGESNCSTQVDIEKYGKVPVIAEIPFLKNLSLNTFKKTTELINMEKTGWIK
jgi:dethiobiotin synthetase